MNTPQVSPDGGGDRGSGGSTLGASDDPDQRDMVLQSAYHGVAFSPDGSRIPGLPTTFLGYLSQHLQQVVVLPAGEMTPTVDAAGLARLLGPEQAERQLADPRQILGAVG